MLSGVPEVSTPIEPELSTTSLPLGFFWTAQSLGTDSGAEWRWAQRMRACSPLSTLPMLWVRYE